MEKRILIRFGDMMLKGQNIGYFIKRVREHIRVKLSDLSVSYILRHDRIMIDYEAKDEMLLEERLKRIPGIYDFAIAFVSTSDLEGIIQTGIIALDHEIEKDGVSLKIETKRTDKKFPMTSQEITQNIAKSILNGTKWQMKVDVNHPEVILYVELRQEASYIYLKTIKGLGGFPYGTGGKGLLMMSGGIDSPVAAYLAMKQGIEVELIHFESTPLTPLESVQKVIDLASILARYTMHGVIKLHLVSFSDIHHTIIENVMDSYMITVMRRMMYRIAERYTYKKDIHCLINGESVGQVASQTLQSMKVVESVTKLPVLRPLVTYDKLDIIKLAKEIKTYEISIKPFNDCCSIYLPKQPVTKPMEVYAKKYEETFHYDQMIESCLSQVKTLEIKADEPFEIMHFGLTLEEALINKKKEMSDACDHIEAE
jgi:thiamine biosynthesis protein ThiI